jgi:hypothetical protein
LRCSFGQIGHIQTTTAIPNALIKMQPLMIDCAMAMAR